jgi:hypothetical protein
MDIPVTVVGVTVLPTICLDITQPSSNVCLLPHIETETMQQ